MSKHTLLQIVLYLHHRLERAQKRRDLPLTLSQYRLLYLIQRGPALSVELATASGMTKPSVGALVAQLEALGWIERKGLQADRRAAAIEITPTGREAVADFESTMHRELEQFLGKREVAAADAELEWLHDLVRERRNQAHAQWALRRAAKVD